jgi:hypothetical protein
MAEKPKEKKVVLFLCPRCGTENSTEDEKCKSEECGAPFKMARSLVETFELGIKLLHPEKVKGKEPESLLDALGKFLGG